MEHVVGLDRLPEGLAFPEDLAGRIRYDGSRGQLGFVGFMSKAEFDRLAGLHESWAYRRALEALFRICTYESDPPGRPVNRLARVLSRLQTRRG